MPNLKQLEDQLENLQTQMQEINEEKNAIYSSYSTSMRALYNRQTPVDEEIVVVERQIRIIRKKNNKLLLKRCVPLSEVLTTNIETTSDSLTDLRFFAASGLEINLTSIRFDYGTWSNEQKLQYNKILANNNQQPPSANLYRDTQIRIPIIRQILKANLPMSNDQFKYYKETGVSATRTRLMTLLVDIHHEKQDD